jgi:hypothetical protein
MIGAAALLPLRLQAEDPKTELQYLSGHGPKDAVPWDFKIEGGRRSGEAATIPVPSNWELHGFGNYTYGNGSAHPKETGYYSRKFTVPENWSGRRINLVFNGVMTDATVKVNGKSAGPTHVGSFYQFKYEITKLLNKEKGAENVLEVEVAKVSSNLAAHQAEHMGDYWVFGGIFRPVWLEALPDRCIEHVAIDAQADGKLTADLTLGFRGPGMLDGPKLPPETIEAQVLDAQGRPVGEPFTQKIRGGGTGRLRISTQIEAPALWTAETPRLYSLRISRKAGDKVVHTVTKRFGFRTFEVRDGQGLFLNGQRILLKGVNRHCFRPESGRALDAEDGYEDVRLIKSMNMNAVRMAHYPPDESFLEACDELGLYVIDELAGWQRAYDTEVGRRLVREMVERDVNHPSILFWTNGNESGWNRDLDGDFELYDPQKRRVLHPWDPFNGVDTKHYPDFKSLIRCLNGSNLVMPTEFLHGLYDGGAGAGLADYWKAISESPLGAGGFIWVFADEGVRRDDQNGRIDVFGVNAPDGIVGPHHEKEGSYYTVRDIWSPVQIAQPVIDEKFTGKLAVTNHYDFTSLAQCRFQWKLLRYPAASDAKTSPQTLAEGKAAPQTIAEGRAPSPAVPPHGAGELALPLPANWREADALTLVAFGPDQQEVWTWVWPLPGLTRAVDPKTMSVGGSPKVETAAGEIRLVADGLTASFDAATGVLKTVRRASGDQPFALTNGPRLAFAKPAPAKSAKPDKSAASIEWLPALAEDAATQIYRLTGGARLASAAQVEIDFKKARSDARYKLEISPDGQRWKTVCEGTQSMNNLRNCPLAPQPVAAVRISRDGQSIAVKSVRLGYAAADFPAEANTPATVTTGSGKDPQTGQPVVWLESRGAGGLNRFRWSLSADGSLRLDYDYTLNGEFLYHGINFDHPEDKMKSLRWLGEGPNRVWQNRLRGTWFGLHETAYNDIQPGESWGYPEFQGYFSGLRWANLETPTGRLTVASASPEVYLRVGTPRISYGFTSTAFPAGDFSFLHAIPAVGAKFGAAELYGPESQPAKAQGNYSGTLTFTFAKAKP